MSRVTLRIDLAPNRQLGPGKVRLLQLVAETGSISAAGRAMGMSYRRAWLLVDALNRMFREPVVATKLGGKAGGGASLTPFGETLVSRYREMERMAHTVCSEHLAALDAALDEPAEPSSEH
ncbi:MAG TPA: LysR family transcriptional regulator [Stellaceae bacterium]|nr:LysR family transcriptional regulator [Stellaceae bacterium]